MYYTCLFGCRRCLKKAKHRPHKHWNRLGFRLKDAHITTRLAVETRSLSRIKKCELDLSASGGDESYRDYIIHQHGSDPPMNRDAYAVINISSGRLEKRRLEHPQQSPIAGVQTNHCSARQRLQKLSAFVYIAKCIRCLNVLCVTESKQEAPLLASLPQQVDRHD